MAALRIGDPRRRETQIGPLVSPRQKAAVAAATAAMRAEGRKALDDGAMMFCGTFAAKGGIRPADNFEFELHDPVLDRTIHHGYSLTKLPVLG